MPAYKLIYLELKARAEPIRYMFKLADVEYEDKRITREEWATMKATAGLGQLPILEVDGEELPQSVAIGRYVATQHGFYPTNSWDQAQVDVVIDTIMELYSDTAHVFYAEDEKKQNLKKKFADEGFLKIASHLEKMLKKNNNGTGWFVGDKLTVADTTVFGMYYDLLPGILDREEGDFDFKHLELLKAFMGRFKAEPKIAAWIAKRPKDPR